MERAAKQIRQTTPYKEYGRRHHASAPPLQQHPYGAARQGPLHCADWQAPDLHREGRLLKVLQLEEAVESATGFLSLGRCKVQTVDPYEVKDEMSRLYQYN